MCIKEIHETSMIAKMNLIVIDVDIVECEIVSKVMIDPKQMCL